jgi:hypothetical protein
MCLKKNKKKKNKNLTFFSHVHLFIYSDYIFTFPIQVGLFWYEWSSLKRSFHSRFKGPQVPKKKQFTHELVK